MIRLSHRRSAVVLPVLTLVGSPLSSGADPSVTFQGLGDLAGGNVSSAALGISADGTAVCGYSSSAASGTSYSEGFRWKVGQGMIPMGDLQVSPFSSEASALSANGSVASGRVYLGITSIRAARWVPPSTLSHIGTLPGGSFSYSVATGISDDGLKIIGQTSSSSGLRAFYWTSGTGLKSIGALPLGTAQFSTARGLSGDATVIVGSSSYQVLFDHDNNPDTDPIITDAGSQAFRWTQATGMVGLPDLPGGGVGGEALAASMNGSVIVGYSASAAGTEGAVWQNGAISGVGDLAGGAVDCRLQDVSADGTLAVGRGRTASGDIAVLWDAAHGLRRLDTLLANAGVNPSGWILRSAVGISADGDVIAGSGVNPSGFPEAWRVTGAQALLAPPQVEPSLPELTVEVGRTLGFLTEPGNLYQVQMSPNLSDWSAVGPVISTIGNAAGGTHSVVLPTPAGSSGSTFYQVKLMPGSASSGVSGVHLDEGAVIGFVPQPGFVYQLKRSGDLASWSMLGSPIDTTGDTAANPRTFNDPFDAVPTLTVPRGFYQLEVTAP